MAKGHIISGLRGGSVVQAIERRQANELWAVSDARKGGVPDGIGYINLFRSFRNLYRRAFYLSEKHNILEEEIEKGRRLTPH